VDSNFGKIYSGSQKPTDFTQIFATVQTLKNDPKLISKLATEYEYIVIDEAHHIGAES
jgi:superfamily II DNA or RNA helicase